tara:strand:+ start:680 stop:1570 length:891 start_codon:yes stop_codon:yes gene_type:complete
MKKYKLINNLKKKIKKGQNIQLYLSKNHSRFKMDKIIELSYDIQSGSYIHKFKKTNSSHLKKKFKYFLNTIKKHFSKTRTILDFGTGEMTNLSFFIGQLSQKITYYANDISLNRVYLGQEFLKKKLKKKLFQKVNVFCSSYDRLPFLDNSIDLVITSHALEPNGKNKRKILNELLRIAKYGIVMQEPHYEIANNTIKKRMNKFNYIKGIKKYFDKKNGKLSIIENVHKTNKKVASVFFYKKKINKSKPKYYVDINTKDNLIRKKNFYYSRKSKQVYPIINNIPVFKDSDLFLPIID